MWLGCTPLGSLAGDIFASLGTRDFSHKYVTDSTNAAVPNTSSCRHCWQGGICRCARPSCRLSISSTDAAHHRREHEENQGRQPRALRSRAPSRLARLRTCCAGAKLHTQRGHNERNNCSSTSHTLAAAPAHVAGENLNPLVGVRAPHIALGCCCKVLREECGVRHSISYVVKEQLLARCWRGARSQAGSRRSGHFGSDRKSMCALNRRPAIEAVNPIAARAAVVKCASDAVMHLSVVDATAFGRLDRRPECGDVPKAVLRTNRERHSDGNGREEDEEAASLVGHVVVSLKLTRPSGTRYLIPRHEADATVRGHLDRGFRQRKFCKNEFWLISKFRVSRRVYYCFHDTQPHLGDI